jgi:ferredoxin
MESAALFAGLARIERNARRRRAFLRLAEVEARHAERFAADLAREGMAPPSFRPGLRTRWLLALAARFGAAAVLPRIACIEGADARSYVERAVEGAPVEEERANALWLAEFAARETGEAAKRLLLRTRRAMIAVVGAALFLASLLLLRNAQLEGLWFGLLTGVVVGPVVHYALGKLLIPLLVGRVWCGWACWTAALLDQLPYRHGAGWLPGPVRHLRAVHFGTSLLLVATLVLAFGYGGGAVGRDAAAWFVVGNAAYWTVGVFLAWAMRDNRAFCKYACPVSVALRLTARPAIVKIAGDADACRTCDSLACTTLCPMDVRIPEYVVSGRRVLSSECIACLQCVAICPPNTLRLSAGMDLGGLELLEERPVAPGRRIAGGEGALR